MHGAGEPSREASATVASGVALMAVTCALGVLSAQLHTSLCAPAVGLSTPVCAAPVELARDGVVFLACAGDAALTGCNSLAAGDRAEIVGDACTVVRGGMSGAARLVAGLPLDINRATAYELTLLDGMGPKIAAQIVADRDARGRFATVGEMARVHGVGDKTLERLRPRLVAGAP